MPATAQLVVTVVALYINHHSLLIPMGYRTMNSEYLEEVSSCLQSESIRSHLAHFKTSGIGQSANMIAKYRYRIVSAVAQARSIAAYATEDSVTPGNA